MNNGLPGIGPPVGNLVVALTIDRATPTTLYAGTLLGAFESTNGGASWIAINNGLASPSSPGCGFGIPPGTPCVFALAIDPATPTTLYAGTNGDGVLKSTDQGASWMPTGLTNTHVVALAIDPVTPATLYAGTGSGVFKSTDAGATWTAINNGLTNTDVSSLVIDPVTPTIVYAGTFGGGVFVLRQAGCSPSFAAIVQNGVAQPSVSPGIITTSFQPGCGLTLEQSAHLGGYDHFNWLQVVTFDSLILDCPLCAVLGGLTYFPPGSLLPVLPQTPYDDPPHGGYVYQGASAFSPVEDNLDWYEDEVYTEGPPFVKADPNRGMCTQLENAEGADLHCSSSNSHILSFEDEPTCQLLNLSSVPCTVNFSTTLVGVRSDGTGDALNVGGTGFDWHVVGTTIGVDQRRQNFQPDPGTLVYFDGFKPSGVAGFSQLELELFAKSGINIRDEAGVVIPVVIDIKPGSSTNPINPQSSGTIPVAILSTASFNAPSQVDANSLSFGRTGDELSLAFCDAGGEDVNGDGLPDLVCHFSTQQAGFQAGDTEGILKGKTLSGTSLYGRDSVSIVPPH